MPILLAAESTYGTVSAVSNKELMGQFFTTSKDVQAVMTSLVSSRSGRALEPSAGEGHLSRALETARPGLTLESVRLDSSLSWDLASHPRIDSDFFSFSSGKSGEFNVIFGNPPYVAIKKSPSLTSRPSRTCYPCIPENKPLPSVHPSLCRSFGARRRIGLYRAGRVAVLDLRGNSALTHVKRGSADALDRLRRGQALSGR